MMLLTNQITLLSLISLSIIPSSVLSVCSSVDQCWASPLTDNSHHVCKKGYCHSACDKGYGHTSANDGKCHLLKGNHSPGGHKSQTPTLAAPVSTPSSSPSSPSPPSPPSPPPPAAAPPVKVPSSLLSSAGVNQFLGTNTGIASWFRTDNSGDSTNGHSWCGFPYDNNVPGFAPDVTTMLNNFGGNYEAAATAYCGLEAEFTTPDGKTATLVIADGFDSKWVLTPGSIDVVTGSFPLLFGSQTDNKNDVVQNVQWKFTGNRNEQYKFKGQGSG